MSGSPLGDYLRARREGVRPSAVGLPVDGKRRVPGLRRQEVAALAGISADYYLRLEQGRDIQPSDQVLNALGRALRLDDESLHYLHRLVHPTAGDVRHTGDARIDAGILKLMASWSATPAIVIDGCMDVLVSNPLAAALSPGVFEPRGNLVLSIFTPLVRQVAPNWERTASEAVAALRLNSDPDDPRLHEVVRMLSADADFARLWARYDVRTDTTGTEAMYVPPFGFVEFGYQDLAVPGHAGLTLTTFFADPGTPGEAVLMYLAGRITSGATIDRATELPGDAATGGRDRVEIARPEARA
jgi:transcriptional regulator with XRE-family HTH domain